MLSNALDDQLRNFKNFIRLIHSSSSLIVEKVLKTSNESKKKSIYVNGGIYILL